MKVITLFHIAILLSIACFAQVPNLMKSNQYAVGENILTGEIIYGEAYNLPGKIIKYDVDSISSNIWIELTNGFSNSMEVQVFDKNLMTGKWSVQFKPVKGGLIYFEDFAVLRTASEQYILDPVSGMVRFKTKLDIQYVIPNLNLDLGYWDKPEYPHALEAFDLQNGVTKWRRKIPRNTAWNRVILESDSTLLISSMGWHNVNLRNGVGWSYEVDDPVFGREDIDFTSHFVTNSRTGRFNGNQVYSDFSGRVKNDIQQSPILINSDYYYILLMHSFLALNKNGKQVWQTPFPDKLIGLNQTFMIGTDIILFNYYPNLGLSVSKNLQKSFIASFDSTTGKQNYMVYPKPPTSDLYVLDYKVIENYIDILYKEKIETFDLRDGKLVFSKFLDDSDFRCYIGDNIFVENKDSLIVPLIESKPGHKFIYTVQNRILEYNGIYERIGEYSYGDYYTLLFDFPGGSVIQNISEIVILDQTNRKTCLLYTPKAPIITNDKLYFINGTQLLLWNGNRLC